jgi:hypothetical protein
MTILTKPLIFRTMIYDVLQKYTNSNLCKKEAASDEQMENTWRELGYIFRFFFLKEL